MAKLIDIVNNDLSANAPDYENNIRSKFIGYNLVMSFPTCPVPSEQNLAFPAYIKKVDDSYNASYQAKEVYGRMDPIPIYQRTTRQIKFDLDLPSNGLAQSQEIAKKLNILVKNLYPTYQKNGSVNIIASPPLVEVGFTNMIYDHYNNTSLLGYFNGGVSISHDLTKGVFSRGDGFETYPKAYTLSFTMNVLHRYTPGYQNIGTQVTNPVNILQSNR
jgi:hypothetical protein